VGVIIVAMVGVGVAEESGLVKALIRKLVIVAPGWALTYILTFVGIVSSIAADAGYLVLIPLAAAAFISRRAASAGGPGGGLRLGRLGLPGEHPDRAGRRHPDRDHQRRDPPGEPERLDRPAANVWFSIGSVVLLTVLIALVTERVIEPRLGPIPATTRCRARRRAVGGRVSRPALRGLRAARRLAFIALLTLPPGAPLRNPTTGAIIGNSPFMNSLIVTIALIFLVCGRPTASAPAP
jgi:aminobenzoyl-glutamate transport protein